MTNSRAIFFTSSPQSDLEEAIRRSDVGDIGRALASGALANASGKQQVTPLMIAVDTQSLAAVEALLKAGANPDASAVDRNSAVSLAVANYRVKPHGRTIMLAVLNGGGDPNARRPDGDPVMIRFTDDHNLEDVRMIHSLGADLDILDRGGDPLITAVAMAQAWDMVWGMIELGARFDYEGGKSRQALSDSLSLGYPAPDSPLYPFKRKVWQLLKDQGLPVKPLRP